MTKQKIKHSFIFASIVIVCALISISINNGREYFEAKERFELKQNELKQVQDEIVQIKNKIALYEQEKKEFEEYLFKEQDIPAFLDDISRMAKDTSVNITDMKTKSFSAVQSSASIETNRAKARVIQNKKNKQQEQLSEEKQLKQMLTLAAMPINMKIEGEFEALLKFFNSIEGFKQLVTVNEVDIVAGKEYPVLKCEYTLKIYSLKTLSEIETR